MAKQRVSRRGKIRLTQAKGSEAKVPTHAAQNSQDLLVKTGGNQQTADGDCSLQAPSKSIPIQQATVDLSSCMLPPTASTPSSATGTNQVGEDSVNTISCTSKRVAVCMNVELTSAELAALESVGGQAVTIAEFGSKATSTAQANELLELIRGGRAIRLWGVVKASHVEKSRMVTRACRSAHRAGIP